MSQGQSVQTNQLIIDVLRETRCSKGLFSITPLFPKHKQSKNYSKYAVKEKDCYENCGKRNEISEQKVSSIHTSFNRFD